MVGDALPSDWRWETLGDVCDPSLRSIVSGPFGSNIGSRFFVDAGVPVIRGNNLTTDAVRFVDDGFVFVTDEKANELRNCDAIAGDLVFTAAGSLGQVGLIPATPRFPRYIISNKQMRARIDLTKVDPLFAFYWFSSEEMVVYVQQRNTGSSVPLINLSVLRSLPLPLPPLNEQRAIAHILGTLDDKIELNRRMSETLEATAHALFKSWFVDFDPVRAKAAKRPQSLHDSIVKLFPNSFEESDVGVLPVGWTRGSILKQARLLSGGTPKTDRPEFWNGDIAWASAKDVSRSSETFLISTERAITQLGVDASATKIIPPFATAVVARGATTGRMVVFGKPMAMNQTCYALESTTGTPFALYCGMKVAIESLVHGAHGSVFDTITTSTFESSRVVLPPDGLLLAFDNLVTPLFRRILSNIRENRTLSELRDVLLPKLITGDLRVQGADRFLEAR